MAEPVSLCGVRKFSLRLPSQDRAREQEEDEVYKSHNKPAKVAAKVGSNAESGET